MNPATTTTTTRPSRARAISVILLVDLPSSVSAMVERPVPQELQRLLDDLPAIHDEGVRAGDDQEVGHAPDLRPLDRDEPIVRPGDEPGEQGIDAAVPRDHAEIEVDGAEPGREARGIGPEPRAVRTAGPPDQWELPKQVGELAAAVRRAEHHDPPQVRQRPIPQVVTQEDPAERVRHEVDAPFGGLADLRQPRAPVIGQILDRPPAGAISHVDDLLSSPP